MKKQYAYLSAAIRDGAALRPQALNESFPTQFMVRRTCAIAAGIEAMFGFQVLRRDAFAANRLFEAFPYVLNAAAGECPSGGDCGNYIGLYGLLVHLNDEHEWTREAIADWLYAEEEKLGFVTLTEEAEVLKPQVGLQLETVKATA